MKPIILAALLAGAAMTATQARANEFDVIVPVAHARALAYFCGFERDKKGEATLARRNGIAPAAIDKGGKHFKMITDSAVSQVSNMEANAKSGYQSRFDICDEGLADYGPNGGVEPHLLLAE